MRLFDSEGRLIVFDAASNVERAIESGYRIAGTVGDSPTPVIGEVGSFAMSDPETSGDDQQHV